MKSRHDDFASLSCSSPSCLNFMPLSLISMLLAQVYSLRITIPDKRCPRRSSVQTVLVQDNGVSSERCLESFFLFALLFGWVRGGNAGKEPHQTKQLLHCLQHKERKKQTCHVILIVFITNRLQKCITQSQLPHTRANNKKVSRNLKPFCLGFGHCHFVTFVPRQLFASYLMINLDKKEKYCEYKTSYTTLQQKKGQKATDYQTPRSHV